MNPLEISSREFCHLVERVTGLSARYLDFLDSQAISPAISGHDSVRRFDSPLPEEGIGDAVLNDITDLTLASRAQNGRFFGYVLGSGEPVAAIADLLTSVLNQNVTAWRSSPAAVTIEHTVVGWLAEAVGCKGFSGSLTGGGSPANLMGLAMAREKIIPANERGAHGGVVYASEEVHMSIGKSVALLGIGRENLHLIPVDDAFRMRTNELEAAIQSDMRAGKTPIAV